MTSALPQRRVGLYAVLGRNIATAYVNYVVVGITGFFLAPFVVHSLGDERYGIWVLVGSLTGHLGLIEAGLVPGIVRAVAERKAAHDWRGLTEVFGTAMVLLLGAALMIVLGAAALSLVLDRWFILPAGHVGEVRWLVLVAGLTLAVEALTALSRGGLAGAQRYDLTSLLHSATTVVQAGAFVLVLALGYGLIAMGVLTLACTALAGVAALLLVGRELPAARVVGARGTLSSLGAMGDFSLKALTVHLAVRLIYYSDSAVIAWALGAAAVTPFAIAARLVEYARHFVRVMGTGLVPAASAIAAAADDQRLRELLVRGTRYLGLIAFPVLAVLFVSGESLLRVWMGPAYAGSHLVLKVLVVGQVVSLLQTPVSLMLYGLGRPGLVALAAATEGVTNLVLSVLLVRPLGILGVALGTAVPALCVESALWVYAARKVFGVRVRELGRRAVLGSLLASTPFGLTLWALDSMVGPESRVSFFLLVAAAGLALLPGVWLFALEESERRRVLAWASLSVLPRLLSSKP